jgi:Undecaprenyl-phosphate glucose phosphotransferase
MYRRHGEKLSLVFLTADLLVTAGSWWAAYIARFTLWPAPGGVPDPYNVLLALPALILLAALAYRQAGLYEIHRLRQLPRELSVIAQASGLLFLLTIAVAFYRRDPYESRLALALFLFINALGLLAMRRVIWIIVKHFRARGLNQGRALIVGAGRCGRRVAQTIRRHHWTGLEPVGFVDYPAAVEPRLLPRLGTPEQLAQLVAQHDIDHVFVALPLDRYGELPTLYRQLNQLLVEIQFVPEIPHLAGMRVREVEIDRLAFLSLRANPHQGWHRAAKRAVDLLGAAAALLLLAPLMLLLALLVKFTSPGPILFRQGRVGMGGRSFEILKFRSMRQDAERDTGPVWAAVSDSRTTSVGRFMRRWNLDELPQLLNVLAGDMSLVGPRPERRVFTEKFGRQLPSYAQRHWVKAGMTGWAQVHGWRGNTSLRRRLECDLYYIANWSLALDFQILWLTLWRGFRDRHAY